MFSVYGKAGRLFRGSLEELRQIGPAAAISRSQRTERIGTPTRDPAGVGAGASHRSAMAAYAQAANSQPPRHPLLRVRDIMSATAFTVPEQASVAQAWELLALHQLGQAPVVDAAGVLVGLLTRADLMSPQRLPGPHSHALAWQALQMQSVADVMWSPVPCVAPDTDIRRLARVLLDTGLPGLPVVDEQGLVSAFVSRTDILRAVVADPPLDLWT